MQQKHSPALIVLEDGTIMTGLSAGAPGEAFGEFVFNTGMTGYQEVLTDPSYCKQIVVMTYPEIGIYGVNAEDAESAGVQVAGFVVHRAVEEPFNQRATESFTDYLKRNGIVAIQDVDTRALTRHLRTHGAMRGVISTTGESAESLLNRVLESASMAGSNLAQVVTTNSVQSVTGEDTSKHVVLVDSGNKGNMVHELNERGVGVTLVPYDSTYTDVMALRPDGVFFSNGPGDPEPLTATIQLCRELIENDVPVAGICLGHQILALALGGVTYKMRFGHRGANHPVKDLRTGRVQITTQNHGFGVDPTSLGIAWSPLDAAYTPTDATLYEQSAAYDVAADVTMASLIPVAPLLGSSPAGLGAVEVTHISLNDGTVEGLRLLDHPAFSVQHHPEACPGPHDAEAFFDEFMSMLNGS